jgi:hypothetical protein
VTNYLILKKYEAFDKDKEATPERVFTDGKPDVKKINPFLLTMPDNRFWAIGECVGNA